MIEKKIFVLDSAKVSYGFSIENQKFLGLHYSITPVMI
jgi:hypothetical protein